DMVAAELNISKPTLYHYFVSKQALLYQCFASTFDAADAALDHAMRREGSSLHKLELYFHEYILIQLEGIARIVPISELRMITTKYSKSLDSRRKARRDKVRSLVQEGIDDGSIRHCDPKLIVSAWAGATSWVFDAYGGATHDDAVGLANELGALFV